MRRLLSVFLSFGLLIPPSVWAGADDPRPADETVPRAGAIPLFTRSVPAGRVRLTTFDKPVGKGGRWYAGQVRGSYEGEIQAIEDGVIVLAQAGGTVVRVPEDDVLGVEVRKNGSGALGVLGVLLGMTTGVFVSFLVCAPEKDCDEFIRGGGAVVGAFLGGAALGAGEWKTVPIARLTPRRVSLVLQPARKGGGVGLQVSF